MFSFCLLCVNCLCFEHFFLHICNNLSDDMLNKFWIYIYNSYWPLPLYWPWGPQTSRELCGEKFGKRSHLLLWHQSEKQTHVDININLSLTIFYQHLFVIKISFDFRKRVILLWNYFKMWYPHSSRGGYLTDDFMSNRFNVYNRPHIYITERIDGTE